VVLIHNIKSDPKAITSILTLRNNPTKKSLIPKLTWKNFVEKKPQNDPISFIEKSVVDTLKKEIKNATKVSLPLSGGVDSTLTLALLRKTFPNLSINTFVVKFPDSVDESKQSKALARKFDVDHSVVHLDNYLREFPKAISIIGLPFWEIHWYYVLKKAKSFSKILLSGDGGDELFGGYTFRYKKFLSLIKSNSNPETKVKAYLNCHQRDWVPDQEKIFGPKAKFSWKKIYNILEPYFDNSLSPLSQVFLADYNGKLLYNWIPNYAKLHQHFKTKQISPLMSEKLTSYATHLPIQQKYDSKKNLGKILLRKLLSKFVNTKLLTPSKRGFSVNTINLWKSYGSEICDYYLSEARTVEDGWLDGEWIRKTMKKTNRDPDFRYVNKFLGLLAFEIWYRLFVTKEMKPNTTLG